MIKHSFTLFRNLLWLWDIICLNLVLFIFSFIIDRADALDRQEYHVLFAAFNLSWMCSVYLTALYLSKKWLDFKTFFKQTIYCYMSTVLMVLFFIFIYNFPFSRIFIITCFAGFATILVLNRLFFNLLVLTLRDKFRLEKNVVFLGYNDQSKRLINYFQRDSKLVKVAACFDDNALADSSPSFPVIRKLKDCMPFVMEHQVKEIYSTLAPESDPYLYELAKDAEKNFVHFKFVPNYDAFISRRVFVDFVDDMPILSLRREPLEDTGNRIKKMAVDIIISSLVTIFILSWLIPILAILIKLDSKGPVFFLQLRSGKDNRPFRCIKLRSLLVNDEAHSKQVTNGDQRITRIGRFMRKNNLDELPQFFNVLLGEMSVVGPRPHMLKHTEDFSVLDKEYMVRHLVKPGLTGWAQVNNLRGEIKEESLLHKRIEHDVWYLENWSLWLDFKIILLTIWVSIKGDKNAY